MGGYDHALWRIEADGDVRLRVRFEERYPPRREGNEQGTRELDLVRAVWLSHGDEVSELDASDGGRPLLHPGGGRWQRAIATDGETVWVGYRRRSA